MILQSALPLELVLEGLEQVGRHRRELKTPQGLVVADVDEYGRVVICRLISTDPSVYLDPRWSPGTEVGG